MKVKAGMVFILVLMLSLLGVYLYRGGGGESDMAAQAEQTYLFVDPAFAQSATAETTFLEEEAGISLYVNIGQSIDLSVAKTAYRTIEKETSNYTVGSIALPNLPESEDVHCFVHKDGWIVAYYLKAEPLSKIVDWNLWSGGQLTKNKLQVALEKMGNVLAVPITGAKYYHFQYPDANKSMLIIETLIAGPAGEDSFNLKIPENFTVYERSWSHYAQLTYSYPSSYPSYFKIDGNTINQISGAGGPVTKYGQLTWSQLPPGVFHTVSISSTWHGVERLYGACVGLVYQEL